MSPGKLDATFSAAKAFVKNYDGPHRQYFDIHAGIFALDQQGSNGSFSSVVATTTEDDLQKHSPEMLKAWENLKDMPQTHAKKSYIELLDSLVEGWRTWRPTSTQQHNARKQLSSSSSSFSSTDKQIITAIHDELSARIDATNCRIEAFECKVQEMESTLRQTTTIVEESIITKQQSSSWYQRIISYIGHTVASLTIRRVLKLSVQWLVPFMFYFCINANFRFHVLRRIQHFLKQSHRRRPDTNVIKNP